MPNNWQLRVFRSLDPERPLDAASILTRGFWDLLATGVLFLLFVGATAALRAGAAIHKDSEVHHSVLVALEYVIFFGGGFFILASVVYLVVIFAWDLWRSFLVLTNEPPLLPDPETSQGAGKTTSDA